MEPGGSYGDGVGSRLGRRERLRVGCHQQGLRIKARTEFPIIYPSGEHFVVSIPHCPCITIRHSGDEGNASLNPLSTALVLSHIPRPMALI